MPELTDAQYHGLALHYSGIHRHEDRDSRAATRAAGTEKKIWSMIRVRVPLGILSPRQYLALDDLAERVTYNNSLRITAGQSIQLHGVDDDNLNSTITTLGSAGLAAGCDPSGLEFAIATSPLPLHSPDYIQLRSIAAELCSELYPKPQSPESADFAQHSPRKFSIGLALPSDNTANVFANDVGLLLIPNRETWRINLYVGGGLSMPGRHPNTYARIASPIGSIAVEQTLTTVNALASLFQRFGKLATRRHTRLKYIVDELGLDLFRAELECEQGYPLGELVLTEEFGIPSGKGPLDQQNGEYSYGINIPYGRIQDGANARYKTAIKLIVQAFDTRVILTPDQNLIFSGLRLHQIESLERILAAYHIPFGDNISPLRFTAMACAGLPTCPLAVAESERAAPELINQLENELDRIGRKDQPFSFRISGCSIGCIRPNMVDLGVIGRKPGHYDVYVGGSEAEGQFGTLYAESVPYQNIIPTIRPLLQFWAEYGHNSEPFSQFYNRWFGSDEKPQKLAPFHTSPVQEKVESLIESTSAPEVIQRFQV